ncbi:alpha-hydroxy-acid oxidizing protein [Micromonospora zhanjiangensis]
MFSLPDVAAAAAGRLAAAHYDFFAGGADDERTLRANTDAFDRYRLRPRVLRGVGERDLTVTVLGQSLSMPVLIAPTAFHRLAHPDGEVGTARAAAAADLARSTDDDASSSASRNAASDFSRRSFSATNAGSAGTGAGGVVPRRRSARAP